MKKTLLSVMAVLCIFAGASAQVPTVSSADNSSEVWYYNLLGQPVGNDLKTGVYIEQQNHASGKITTTKRLISK